MVPKDTETERRWIWTGCSWRGPSHCVCNTALPQQRMHNQIKNRQTNKAATLPATVCIWIQTKLSSIILSLPLKTCWEKWFLWSTCTCSEGSSRSGFHRPRETSLDDINLRLVKPHLTSAPVPTEPNQSHRLNASGLSLLLYSTYQPLSSCCGLLSKRRPWAKRSAQTQASHPIKALCWATILIWVKSSKKSTKSHWERLSFSQMLCLGNLKMCSSSTLRSKSYLCSRHEKATNSLAFL